MEIKIDLTNLKDFDKIASFRKENHFYKETKIVSFDKSTNEFSTPVFIRYYATQATHYCCLWVSSKECGYFHGGGKAGGYGYHRESSALQEALNSMNLKLDKSIAGTGQEYEFLTELANTLGLEHYVILYSHA